MRTFGVEEEFLLVDPGSGRPLPLGQEAFGLCPDDRVTYQIKQEQIETGTRPHDDVNDLALDIARCRALADEAATRVGTRAAALATSPQPARPVASPGGRYEEMQDRFAVTASEQLTCGCHVHVGVEDDDEGVAVLDRILPWLPVLLALRLFALLERYGHRLCQLPVAGPEPPADDGSIRALRHGGAVPRDHQRAARHERAAGCGPDLLRRAAEPPPSHGGGTGQRRVPVLR